MIRSILLPLADGPMSGNAKDCAFWLARKEGSRIHALAVIDVKAFEIPVLGTPDGFMPSVVAPPLEESQSLLDEMNALAKERLDQFAAECAARGIPCSTDARTGIPGDLVVRDVVAHDIVVMARSGYSRVVGAQGKIDPLVSHVLRGSIRPVLVAGRGFHEGSEVRTILMAFDGSVHAGRALMAAAELGGRPGVICRLVAVASSDEAGRDVLAPAESFLRHHGVTPEKRVVIGSKASEVICSLVTEGRADILIMGAYGHSPMREMLFGSTTERVLSHCGATVLLQS
ncbi:MAG TPA: universal stress protein [Acidobacteriota bacterium]|nr:universal stress protein [Acidobacteriota bacterium]